MSFCSCLAKKAQYYYSSMACGLIFTLLMMAFTDFFASIFFSFRRVIWNLAHAAAKPQLEFVCELHPLTQHLVFQYFLLLFPEKTSTISFSQNNNFTHLKTGRSFGLYLEHPSHYRTMQHAYYFLLETLIPLGQATKGRNFVLLSHAMWDHKDFFPLKSARILTFLVDVRQKGCRSGMRHLKNR